MTQEISPSMPSDAESTAPSGLYGFNMTLSRFSSFEPQWNDSQEKYRNKAKIVIRS